MANDHLNVNGVRVPHFLYGTAWKEDATRRLTELAIEQGFRGIDTANQRRHYHEAAVGAALAATISRGLVTRGDLFLQTKFTFRGGQDHRLPYDPNAPIASQVEQSFASSREHLSVEVIDSYLLHGPMTRRGLTPEDWAAWHAMEDIHDSGQTRALGISNVALDQLQALWSKARIRPRFVQNRCFAVHGWDWDVREFCRAHEIVYQGFSLLTANPHVLTHTAVVGIAHKYGRSPAEIVFRFALNMGILPLAGTSNADHMRADLDVANFEISPQEAAQLEQLASR